ncbi:hypothetical protein I6A84_25675 [Frankia sp. CNm7]|uniref:Lipoprotein n=1 Tax=Frankia nepalensis TaxID=1836974 RepID=A0A937UNI3_9ACTN|nr:hypothetical protein [Frankia nepalensis]MBL7502101.1 hypothetical protein [Frankia nepalensis]MBL7514773.1 hypothetical protein [Frankia nepalensis]MBL7521379.1 hypothetical protein [Frankia nepalensis]MBL7628123.1 hypothetical protein [Frankia nepalensis]
MIGNRGQRLSLAALVTSLALFTTACTGGGSAAPSAPSQISGLAPAAVVAKSVEAFGGASSFHVLFSGMSADLVPSGYDSNVSGPAAAGNFEFAGVAVRVVRTGAVYFEAPDAAALQLFGLTTHLNGTWFKGSATRFLATNVADSLSLAFWHQLLDAAGRVSGWSFRRTAPDVVVLAASSTRGAEYELTVANSGKPYPLRLRMSAGENETRDYRFSEFDHQVRPSAPAEPIDVDTFSSATPRASVTPR